MDRSKGQCHGPDFLFAFNASNFSDRMLKIQVLPDSEGGDMLDLITDCRRGIEDDPKSASNHIGSGMAMDNSNIAPVRVNSLYVNSAILAEKSAFFRKLFSNGMRESKEYNITIQISCSEEMAFTDLLQYMYGGTPGARSTEELLNVLMVADKFEVTSCVEWCSSALQNSPISTETALLYMDLPQSLLTNDSVKSLIDTAKKFILEQFGDMEMFAEALTNLPLSVIEVVLSSDELRVESEDALFDFVIKWARKHYSNVQERREVLSNRLCHLIRFPNMSHQKLNNVISCSDLDTVYALKAVSEALHLKTEALHKRCNGRDYKHFPVTVLEFDAPIRECSVYWNIRKSEPMPLCSQPFRFDGLNFQIRCIVNFERRNGRPNGFKVIVSVIDHDIDEQRLERDTIVADLSMRMLPNCDFRLCNNTRYSLRVRSYALGGVILPVNLHALEAQDKQVFVNDVMHLKLHLMFQLW